MFLYHLSDRAGRHCYCTIGCDIPGALLVCILNLFFFNVILANILIMKIFVEMSTIDAIRYTSYVGKASLIHFLNDVSILPKDVMKKENFVLFQSIQYGSSFRWLTYVLRCSRTNTIGWCDE